MTLKEQAEQLGIKVDGRWSDERIQKEIDKLGASDAVPQAKEEAAEEVRDEMNDLARRIWDGQSVSLPVKLRIERIEARLRDKGYTDKQIESLNIG